MTTFAEAMARLRAGVEAAAASAGLEVSGELRGVVCDAGRPETGTGFAVAIGAGLPPGWVPHAEVGALRVELEGMAKANALLTAGMGDVCEGRDELKHENRSLVAEVERLRAVIAEKGGS